MASVLGLALKISADATGIQKSLTPVERALKQLDTEAAKVTEVFKTFATASGGAGRAQQQFATDLAFLQSALRTGKIDGEQFAAEFEKISAEATKTAEAFREGAAITVANRTEEEKRAEELARLNELLKLGAIEQETFNRAAAEASGANKAAAAAAAEAAKTAAAADKTRADQATRAAAIVEANLTKEQKAQRDYGVSTRELNALRKAGLLTEAEYSTALQRVSTDYAKATLAADKFGKESGKSGDAGVLKFNELSGILSALPGPIGNVAGRLSGLSSAGEGLARVFSGGLSQGISSVGASVAGLINPFTAAVAGVAAFGAGAVAVTRGLIDLEDRVERLSRLATQLGVSFEFVQVLEEAGRRADVSVEALGGAFGRLQKTLAGADDESKKAAESLQRLGVSVEDFGALSQEQQIDLIGEKLATIEDPAQRSAAAIALFGKSGISLLPFFRELPGASTDMERFGRAVSELDQQRLADFGGGLDALQVATQGLGQSLLLPFVGLGEGVAQASAEFVSSVTAVVDAIGRTLSPALDQIGDLVSAVGSVLGTLAPVFRVLAEVIEPIGAYLLPAVVAQMIALNRAAVFGAISSLASTFAAAATAAVAYATGAGTAAAATTVLAASVRGLLASTGVGALVVGLGLAANALISYFSTADEAADKLDKSAKSSAAAGDAAKNAAAQQKELLEQEKKTQEERERTFQRLREEVNNAIDDSRKFGAAGTQAAASYDRAVEGLKQRLSSGIIDQEQFRRSVRTAGQVFDAEIKAIEDRSQLEIKVKENAEKAIEKVADQIDKAAIKAEDFGAAGDRALDQFAGRANTLKLQFSAGLIDEKQLEQGVAAANREYDKQIEKIKQANTERQKQIEDDRKRSESLLDEMDKTRAVQRDREAVERDVARLRSEAAAQGFFTPEQREQLLDLQQLQGELAEKQRAVAQGFEKGYAEAFDKTADKFDSLVVKSEEFGAAGQEAARRLADGLNNAARLAERGAIGEEAYNREVARQERLYENEIAGLKKAADERLKVNEAVDQILLLQSVNGDSQRAEAKKQVLAIEQEIARVQEEIAAAREADDTEAVNAGAARLAQLDQAAAKERDIASGAAKQREEFQKKSEENLKAQQQQQQQYAQQQAKIFEEQQKAAAAEAKRQEERLEKLNTLGATTIKSQDVRTTEGASLVLQTIANGQDPALIQQRLQTKYLEAIAAGIGQASSNYFNSPVAIVGYSSFGQQR
jgi:hypothetical protein